MFSKVCKMMETVINSLKQMVHCPLVLKFVFILKKMVISQMLYPEYDLCLAKLISSAWLYGFEIGIYMQTSSLSNVNAFLWHLQRHFVHVMVAKISSYHSVDMVWNSRTDCHLLAPPVKWQESNWNRKPELPFNNNTSALWVIATSDFYWRVTRFITSCKVYLRVISFIFLKVHTFL